LTRHIWGDSVYISCYQKLCHSATGIFATENRHFSNNNLYFTNRTSCNITSSTNKSRRYLHIIVSCCGLEFQFLSVPTHSRLPSRSTCSTFYVPNPLSPLRYNNITTLLPSRFIGVNGSQLFEVVKVSHDIFHQHIILLCLPLCVICDCMVSHLVLLSICDVNICCWTIRRKVETHTV